MKTVYERENLKITEFDAEDVITTSGIGPDNPGTDTPVTSILKIVENARIDIKNFDPFAGQDTSNWL